MSQTVTPTRTADAGCSDSSRATAARLRPGSSSAATAPAAMAAEPIHSAGVSPSTKDCGEA